MYVMVGTRPDIAFAVNLLARFGEDSKVVHWNAVKRVLQYLQATQKFGIEYRQSFEEMECHVDLDYAGCLDTRRSTSGYIIHLAGGPVIWKSAKQATVATSTVEAEFIAASHACEDVLWTQNILLELGRGVKRPTKMYVDNQGAIKVAQNNQIHAKTKLIDIKHMFIGEAVERKKIELPSIKTENQLADILTKTVNRDRFLELKNKTGIIEHDPKRNVGFSGSFTNHGRYQQPGTSRIRNFATLPQSLPRYYEYPAIPLRV